LLVGAPVNSYLAKHDFFENPKCKFSLSSAREKLLDAGRLRALGVSQPRKFNDSTQYQLQVGYGGINGSVTRQYKRVPGQSLKNVLFELWAMEPDLREPKMLNDLYGIKVSMCTQNALRTSLSQLLSLNCMRSYLSNFKWDNATYESKYYETLKDCPPRMLLEDKTFREKYEKAVLLCLKMLTKTGVDCNKDLLVFLSSPHTAKPELATLIAKHHSWAGLLRDTITDCSMVAFADQCLEFHHDKGVACGIRGNTVLRTALIPNTKDMVLDVVKVELQDDTEGWSARWDVTALKPGRQIWLGERGELSLVALMPDGSLLVKWRPSMVALKMKRLLKSQELPHREFVEIQDNESKRKAVRPIRVFIMSDRVSET